MGASTGDEVVYFCRDNGAGFDMRDAAKIFDVFHRMHAHEDFVANLDLPRAELVAAIRSAWPPAWPRRKPKC